MIRTARDNRPASLRDRIRFDVMDNGALAFAPETFDVVLCRHARAGPGRAGAPPWRRPSSST